MVKLLLVDDSKERLEVLRRIARRLGIREIVECQDTRQVQELINAGVEFQLAVIDIVLTSLPDKLGLQLISLIKRRQPMCKIIALTGQGDTTLGIEALNAGADDFVSTLWESIRWSQLLEIRLELWRGTIEQSQVPV